MAATPIPPILDQDRYARYEPVAPTTDFDVPFPYFGTDASELLVLVDGVKVSAFVVVSRSAGALANAVLPVEDAVVRLATCISGVAVEIYGSIRPRRTVQATAAFGTRDFNFVFSYVVAALREMWSQFTRAIQVPPGESAIILPASGERAGKVLGFGPDGMPLALTPMSGGVVGTSSIIDGAVTTPKVADGAVTLAKLAAVLLGGTAGALIQWAAGPKYPAGDGSAITNLTASQFAASLWPAGYLSGLTLGYVTAYTFSVAPGDCRNEDGGTAQSMSLAATFTKNLNGWTSGLGSLDTGAIAANTWYHVHLIRKDSDGSINVLLSLSPTAPTMPLGYTARRRLGSIKTNGSSQLTQWTQLGDEFLWSAAVVDFDVVNPGTAAALRTISVPTGIQVLAVCMPMVFAGNTTNITGWFSSPDASDQAPQTLNNTPALTGVISSISATSAPSWQAAEYRIRTNASAQIRTRLSASGAADRVGCITRGWIDARGKN